MTPTCSRCDSGLTRRYAIIDGENHCLPCVCDWAIGQLDDRAARAAEKVIEGRRFGGILVVDFIAQGNRRDCDALRAAGAILRSLQLEGD